MTQSRTASKAVLGLLQTPRLLTLGVILITADVTAKAHARIVKQAKPFMEISTFVATGS